MDTSEQYIKMCEKAEEIQGSWEPSKFDIAYDIEFNRNIWRSRAARVITIVFEDGNFWVDMTQGSTKKDEYIWLPRQDQLQEMVACPEECPAMLIVGRFKKFLGPMLSAYKFYWSMEQLWLAFVMKEKYNKVWNGEDWLLK